MATLRTFGRIEPSVLFRKPGGLGQNPWDGQPLLIISLDPSKTLGRVNEEQLDKRWVILTHQNACVGFFKNCTLNNMGQRNDARHGFQPKVSLLTVQIVADAIIFQSSCNMFSFSAAPL